MVGAPHTKLIILRGNSGSGKGATAAGLRARYGRGLAIIGQDAIRRDMLKEKDHPDALNISVIDMLARRLLDEGMHVVVEGILAASRYGDMLTALHTDHAGDTYRYYFDLPFHTTVQRHWTKPNAHAFSLDDMRSWFLEGDVLPGGTDRIIGADSTLTTTVERILAETNLLAAPRPVHPSLAADRPATEPATPAAPAGPRHTARAVIVDDGHLVLIKRVQPARDPEPYWVTVGGGIEPGDAGPEAAMRREVAEEIGGAVGAAQLIYLCPEPKPEGVRQVHFFLAPLLHMDTAAATGSEFTQPERGTYEIQKIPFTAAGISSVRLLPPQLADYLAANSDGLREMAAFLKARDGGGPPEETSAEEQATTAAREGVSS